MVCSKIKSQLKALLRHFDNYVDAHIDTALEITTRLKQAISSPAADIVSEIIPGQLDDAIRRKVIDGLGIAVDALGILDSCRQYTDLNQKLSCFMSQLQKRNPQLQDAILQKIASLLSSYLDGGRLKQSLYDLYAQAKYAAAK